MNLWGWTIWTQILFATSLALTWPIETHTLNLHDPVNGICQRRYIRNILSAQTMLQGCEVIEGSLQISLMTANSSDAYSNITFPKLREITGYFMLFANINLTTMGKMFPNLAVIRGQELIDTHALVISAMQQMQEVGLPALTNILRGTVWIVDNPNLCYVDTIDWGKIANESSADGIYKNKPQCPNTCPEHCPESDFGLRKLCWSNGICQIVHQQMCPKCEGRPCSRTGDHCCHRTCLGGCTGPKPEHCDVCRHVKYENVCADECPAGLYEYLQRRCVSKDECLEIVSIPEQGGKHPSGSLRGKWHTDDNGKNMCVLECPKNTELASNGTACVRCEGICRKNCPGRTVDNIDAVRELSGCTRITGALKIYIRRASGSAALSIVNELKQNLDKIEEIDDYLAITYTFSIYSLDFLENLKVIRGNLLEEDKYALVIKSNENLMELWNSESSPLRKVKIVNKEARVLFYNNPKLCPSRIWKFVELSEINPKDPKEDKIDIGITNGDKTICNKITLGLGNITTTNSSVTIQFENFRRNLKYTSHLLNYEIHYKEIIGNKTVSKFDDRDPCGYDGWHIAEQAKIKDGEVIGGLQNEPAWENDKLITNLKPFTEYAIYVKAIVIPDENSLNNNTGAESEIKTFRTLADTPSKPKTFLLAASGPNSVTMSWEPPVSPNGVMQKFKIWIKAVPENQSIQDQRDFCKHGRSPPKVRSQSTMPSFTESIISSKPGLKQSKVADSDCCACSASGSPKKDKNFKEAVFYEDEMLNTIMRHTLPTPVSDKEDRSSNEVRKSRKRRSLDPASGSFEVGEDRELKVKEFPYDNARSGANEENFFPIQDMNMTVEVKYNSSITKYTHVLENLTHYTTYYIGIQACRDEDPLIKAKDNDTRICSSIAHDTVQTTLSATADNIIPKSISINVTDHKGKQLHLRWAEPLSPNGVIMAYTVKVSRVGAGTDVPDIIRCITRKDFLAKDRNYTLPDVLHSGNYSVRIRVASLAQDSEFTVEQYFEVEDLDSSFGGLWAVIILLPILLIILLGSFLVFYYIRSKGLVYGRQVISANPEYMQNVDIPEEWEVSRDKVDLIEEIGDGSFGKVYKGYLKDFISGQPKYVCAVKTVFDDTPSEDRALFLKEAALMTHLNCYHVVKLLGVTSKSQPIYVIMELMTNGDLKKFLKSRRPDPTTGKANPLQPTLRQILKIAAEISDGMAYIHSHRLVHRDLAARNCMVAEDMSVKVGDFGMTKDLIQSDYYRKQTRGLLPVRWMAPESLKDGVFTNQSDVWSFGVVLWEMATLAAQPYLGLGHLQVLEYVLSGRIMERPENCPDILYDLMVQCWQFDERSRPTFFDILDKLTPDLEPHFAEVSFFNSSDGIEYRAQLQMRPTQDELITIRTPLRATFDASDDDDEYDSDDNHHPLNHHIVDDLGDTPSRRLMSKSPSPNPQVVKSLANGLALAPSAISGTNSSGIRNGNPGSSYSSVSTLPSSLFTNPPLLTNFSAMPNANSNNNNTTAIPSVPNYGVVNSNSISNQPSTKISYPVNSGRVNSTNSNIGNGPVNTTYASIVPNSGQVNNVSDANNGGTGLESNESSKSYSINFSGDGHKVGNGGSGGNGYITLRHSPVNENQRTRTTQF